MRISTFFIIVFLSGSILSQSGLYWQNPLPQGMDLRDIYFVSQTTGWAVGDCGTIIKTTDAGNTWRDKSITAGQLTAWGRWSLKINKISFFDEMYGICLLNNGILSTSDGGENWKQHGYYNHSFKDIEFIDSTSWIIVGGEPNIGGIVLLSSDRGRVWRQKTAGSSSLTGAAFYDNLNGTAITSNGKILITSDQGNTWDIVTTSAAYTGFNDVFAPDSTTGVIVGDYGLILLTRDKGKTWERVTADTTSPFYSVTFINKLTGFITGHDVFLKTTDGGLNWTITQMDKGLSSAFFFDEYKGFIVGKGGLILKTTNSGISWTSLSSGERDHIKYLKFYDENNGMAVGDSTIFRTSDGGRNWTAEQAERTGYLKFFFIDEKGWAVGTEGTILHTSDGGKSWNPQNSGTYSSLADVYFVNESTGTVVGDKVILKTTDGGESWFFQSLDVPLEIYKVLFTDSENGIALGRQWNNETYILRTTNGGSNWTIQHMAAPVSGLIDIFSLDNNRSWILGGSYILRTIDGWITLDSLATVEYCANKSISFTDENRGILYCNDRIFLTTDGGTSWSLTAELCYIWNVVMVNSSTCYALGYSGTIIKIELPMITDAGEQQLILNENFVLFQSYPNPFNPVTKIKFSVPMQQEVEIKIYDVLGNEVGTLIRETLSPGVYEREWSGRDYSSGVYFYRLTAGEFVQTRKMILVK
jgi:photosystem II stability/assembly factor-like uncharacterized protein